MRSPTKALFAIAYTAGVRLWKDRLVADSDPILVDSESSGDEPGRVAPWMLVAAGTLAGAALAVVFGLTGGGTRDSASSPSAPTTTPVTTVPPPTRPDETTGEDSISAEDIPEGFLFSPLMVVRGDYPDTGVERWSPDGVEEAFGLPWATGPLGTDASGNLFAFSGQSATGRSLFVGRDDRYVVLSATAQSWAWHATEPATLAWLDTSGGERTVLATRLELEPARAPGHEHSPWIESGKGLETNQETEQLVTARPEERIRGFTTAGVVLGAPDEPATRVIDLDGNTVASNDTLLALSDGFSADGWAVMKTQQLEYNIVDSDLEVQADLGPILLRSELVAWSPDGQRVAVVEEPGVADFHLQLFNRTGEELYEKALAHRVWDVTWLPTGQLAMAAIDDSGWQGLLFVDPETDEINRIQAGGDPIHDFAIGED